MLISVRCGNGKSSDFPLSAWLRIILELSNEIPLNMLIDSGRVLSTWLIASWKIAWHLSFTSYILHSSSLLKPDVRLTMWIPIYVSNLTPRSAFPKNHNVVSLLWSLPYKLSWCITNCPEIWRGSPFAWWNNELREKILRLLELKTQQGRGNSSYLPIFSLICRHLCLAFILNFASQVLK